MEPESEIDDVTIPPILYITGLERSGTTLLHNLLALHPKSRALLRWELMRPSPPPEASNYRTDPRIAEVQASIDRLRGTELERMHWVNANEPEECTWGALDCTGLLGRGVITLMPIWGRWLEDNDLTPSFQEYRRLIKLLFGATHRRKAGISFSNVRRTHATSGNSPVFPEARFVFTHRDPFRACASVCTLARDVTAPLSAGEDIWRSNGFAVNYFVRFVERGLTQLMAFDQEASVGSRRWRTLRWCGSLQLVVQSVYARLGFEAPKDLASRVGAYQATTSGRRAAPPIDLPTYGLDHDAFLARPVVASYCKWFGVAPEMARLTGVEQEESPPNCRHPPSRSRMTGERRLC